MVFSLMFLSYTPSTEEVSIPQVTTAVAEESPHLICSASAYTEAEDECGKSPSDPAYGITASGEYVRRGIIAVDTDVIPMHSLVRIEGAGEYDGIYGAKDTGGYIQGNRIDIYMPTKTEAINFGRKDVKVYVIRYGA